MSDGAVIGLVLGGLVVAGIGVGWYVHHRRVAVIHPSTLPQARTSYGQAAAVAGPSVASQVLGAATSIADTYLASDAGS